MLERPRSRNFVFIAFAGLWLTSNHTYAGPLFGVHFDTGDIYSISETNGATALVGSTGVPHLGALEMSPDGFLYSFSTGEAPIPGLYRINPATFSALRVGTLDGDFTFEGALVLAPGGAMYGAAQDDEQNPLLFTVNLETARTTVIGTVSGGFHDFNGLAWRGDGMLVGLDRVTNSLLAINPTTAVSSPIAQIDETVGAVGGMTVLDGTAYFNTSGLGLPSPGSNQLFSLDLFNGAHTLIGNFDPDVITGTGISGLAIVPEPASLMLILSVGWLIRRPGRIPHS